MVKHLRRLLAATLFLSSLSALSQATQQTPTQRLLSHFDGALAGVGVITKSTTGSTSVPALASNTVTQAGSNTFGALLTLRATKSPYIGAEFNYGYSRFTQTYDSPRAPAGTTCCNPTLSLQNNAHEFTVGYLVRPDREFFFGAKPYASVGAGSIAFRPTKGGGQGLQTQARAVYYYHVGLDAPLTTNAGVRIGFRQLFYLNPDFGQNYITTKQRTFTSEPVIGFYYHF